MSPKASLQFVLPDEEATARLAAALARLARRGDIFALSGDLGAGKTTFARGFIRAFGIDEEVPSPTFTLVQTYLADAGTGPTIWHFDLYRIERPEDAYELDIEDAFADGISLIEWPANLGALLPEDCLKISLSMANTPGARTVTLEGPAAWADRLTGLEAAMEPAP